uniref:Dol-P-Glc:Glc(2)Man(9)GlcNAc(2)-PP-Dol alpha-1,2-glucosyltransferase n=1 Tax=Strongyloides stercoralis TaxID=6248 RepID=A0AAF5DHZ2_STRER
MFLTKENFTAIIWCKTLFIIHYYITSIIKIVDTVMERTYPIIIFGGFLSLALCIVPAGLLEFRYFIIHFALWRLSIQYNSKISLIGELLISLLINCIVLYLFLFKPFVWPSEPNSLQRFM